MQGIPIKFRAKLCETNEYVYSAYVKQNKKDLTRGYIEGKKVYDIRQLVGYDAADNEVYEGDRLNCYSGFCLPASELVKKEIRCVSKVKLIATVERVGENLNSPFDYQFLLKSRIK